MPKTPALLKRIIILLLFPLYRRRYLRYRDAAWAQGYAAMSYEMWFRDVRPISY